MLFDHLPFIHQCDDWKKVQEEAKADGHSTFIPTDVVKKNSEIVGYISMGAVPLVMTWLHTSKISPRDTLQLLATVEGVQRRLMAPGVIFPCTKESPFHPAMGTLGYDNMGSYDLFLKLFN